MEEHGGKYLLQSTAGVPMCSLRVLNTSAEMIAPAFPDAAEIPWAVARNRVGNTAARLIRQEDAVGKVETHLRPGSTIQIPMRPSESLAC